MDIPFELMEQIFERVATSDVGLHTALKEFQARGIITPSISVVYKMMDSDKSLQEIAARARARQADYLSELAAEVAKNPWPSTITKRVRRKQKDGSYIEVVKTRTDNTERTKLYLQTIARRASQLAPKKYGEALIHRGDADNPIEVITREEAIGKLLGHREAQKPD